MKDRIDAYWELGPEERRAVEEYVADHPELVPRLKRVQALASLIDEARSAPPSDEDVARYVTRGMFGGTSELTESELARLANEIETDPEVAARAARMEVRLQELGRMHDPVAHFEALRGESTAPADETSLRRLDDVQEADTDQDAFPLRRWAIAAVMGFLVLAASFVVLQIATTSRLDRLAHFQADELESAPYELRTRSAVEPAPTDSLFLQALSLLRGAQRSYFGLFYEYDEDAMATAGETLSELLDSEEGETYLTLEARYLLAKILIHQGRLGGASEQLDTVITEGGGRTSRARELLSELEKRR